MKLTEEIKQSILKESKNMRELNLLMNRSKTSSAEENYTGRKKIPLLIRLKYNSGIQFSCFDHALHNYMNHIRSLEEGSEIELFNYEKYKYKEQ